MVKRCENLPLSPNGRIPVYSERIVPELGSSPPRTSGDLITQRRRRAAGRPPRRTRSQHTANHLTNTSELHPTTNGKLNLRASSLATAGSDGFRRWRRRLSVRRHRRTAAAAGLRHRRQAQDGENT